MGETVGIGKQCYVLRHYAIKLFFGQCPRTLGTYRMSTGNRDEVRRAWSLHDGTVSSEFVPGCQPERSY
jgi:hypothetical protein